MAAGVRWLDQADTAPSLGLAADNAEPRLHPAFAGSFSLKAVLPAFVPEMTYEGMEVGNGTDAGLAWGSLVRGGLGKVERLRIENALPEYCGQDTLALIRLLEKLQPK
jgi:hypothetical protein